MSRVKTFDATGIAPGGVLFAGDMNNIQDKYADLSNFAQTVDMATLRVGDSSIQLLKYGTAEARISAALRTDGVVRGLGGLSPGAFTTTQRDAIALGSRPQGMLIFNTTTGALEINKGTDATPSWATVGADAFPIGAVIPFTGAEGSIPAGYGLADGTAISRTTYSVLNALYSAQSYPFGTGDGSTTFNKPDMRGRVPAGRDNMGGTVASRMSGVNSMGAVGGAATVALVSGEMPVHDHGGATSAGTSGGTAPATGTNSVDHSHNVSGSTGGRSAAHTHGMSRNTATIQFGGGSTFGGYTKEVGASGFAVGVGMDTESADHSHAFNVQSLGESVSHTHTVNSHTHTVPGLTIGQAGSGQAHNNLQPYLACNWIVKLV